MSQKTWADLLGKDSTNCIVSGLDIVRKFDDNKFTVLWSFETSASAWESFYAWRQELTPAQPVTKELMKDNLNFEQYITEYATRCGCSHNQAMRDVMVEIRRFAGVEFNQLLDASQEVLEEELQQELDAENQPKWMIQDWTGKRLFPDKEFDSYQDGWDFVLENFKTDEDAEEIYVVRTDNPNGE